jgi:D-glycero-alpha-D-manno-heptose-7-phosphate kinase
VAIRAVEATAPTRVDLAGGTLDIWPLYLLHPGAVTVNVAIDRRAWCRVETGADGVRIESRDTLSAVQGKDVEEVIGAGTLTLPAFILRALGIRTGVRLVLQSRVPAGSGLGGSSALAVVVAAAASRAVGRPIEGEALVALVRDAECQAIGVPTGVQDYWAAVLGGVLCVCLEPGAVRAARLAVEPERVEGSLLLVDAGATRFSGMNNWEVFKRRFDADPAVTQALGDIAALAIRVRDALESGRHHDLGQLVAGEWEARKRLAPAVTTPEIDRIVEAARSAGAAAKVCGAGGGGVVAVWAGPEPGGRDAAIEALGAAGFAPMPFRVDSGGLRVDAL